MWVVIGVTPQKVCLDWDSNPRPGNVEFDVELELPQYDVFFIWKKNQREEILKKKRESLTGDGADRSSGQGQAVCQRPSLFKVRSNTH